MTEGVWEAAPFTCNMERISIYVVNVKNYNEM